MIGRWCVVMLGAFCSLGAAQDASRGAGAAPTSWETRLEALTPQSPGSYLELGEEVQAATQDAASRALARRLYVLALVTGLDAGDRATSGGACLALAELAEDQRERRWLLALARRVDDRIGIEPEPAGADATGAGLEASLAIARVRAGEARIARRTLDDPETASLIRVHASDSWITRLDTEARAWPCPECRNERFVPDPDRPSERRLCATCAGNPGPALDRAQLLEHLRIEAALLGVRADSWSAQLAMGRDQPLREADPREVAPHYAVDPALACWRDGAWTACPDADADADP